MAPQGHIMLSYQWDYQKQVIKIRDALKAFGFKVWMDIDSMRGDIYEKMAEGVEGASVIIVCMSTKYQSSESCKREFQYAQDRKKGIIPIKLESGFNATGALGLVTAGRLYIDFSNSSKFNENMQGLKLEIEAKTGKVQKEKEEPQQSPFTNINIFGGNVVIGDRGEFHGEAAQPVEESKPVTKADGERLDGLNSRMIPICVGHAPNGVSRVGIGEHASCLGAEHDILLYASDTQLEGMSPISVGNAGSGDDFRHRVEQGTFAGNRGWNHDFVFYAFLHQVPDTIPYAVGHSQYEDGWKYRVSENVTFAGDKVWTHDFVFYAFPVNPENMLPISVGSYSGHSTAKVVAGVTAKDDLFEHVFTFKALEKSHPGSVPIAVGSAGGGDHRRHRLLKGTFAGDDGWNHDFVFYAFKNRMPGTIPIAVGHSVYHSGGWRYRISENCKFAGDNGWSHDFVFYAFPADTSMLMPISVGFESANRCARVKEGTRLQELYFEHDFAFFGFRTPYPGSMPVAIGEAGADYNHTLRSRIIRGTHAGGDGWDHVFPFYAFPVRKPGTVQIAIGHADFALGGWKYRVCEDCDNAGTEGWTHDFTFWAYPHPK